MKLFRLLVVLGLVVASLGGPSGAPAAVAAQPTVAAVAPEDEALQVRVLGEAYDLLMDHFVRPLDSAALLDAGWDELVHEADGKAAPPGPPPALSGDRTADLAAMRSALAEYVDQPDSGGKGLVAVHALLRGMVHFVNEGHTYFLDPQQYQDYQSWSRGDNRYVGIGISLSSRDAAPHIVEVYDGTPAQKAGLQAGDVLVSIDEQSIADMPIDQLTSLVRGPVGSTVKLTVRRGDDPTPLTFSIARAEIHLQFVTQRRLADDIGYLSLRGFPEPSVVQTIEQDVAKFEQEGVHGLVLDLRGNSGGRIDVGTRLLGDFLPSGSSVYEEVDRGGQNRVHFSRGTNQYGIPLVVLVDGGTASMGEIFAAAVQEHGAATVLGQNTAGSVAAAQVFGLPDGSGLQVTVFDILSGGGKPLNRVGVAPDEVIEAGPGDLASGADPVLARAVEILHSSGQGSEVSVQ